MAAFKWICPYCNLLQTVIDRQREVSLASCEITNQAEGALCLQTVSIGCSNPECLRTTIHATIGAAYYRDTFQLKPNQTPLFSQYLMPHGNAKSQPDYVPRAVREDYYEACLIRDLSPKASATLTRRCLQGIIRDFAGISGSRLVDEIDTLRKAVEDGSADRAISPESVEAIDHVRGIGNIGAHMEKDIDLIVPVDPGEAQALIELIEMLFDEWYGARERRKTRLARIEGIAGEKKALKTAPKNHRALLAPTNGEQEIAPASTALEVE